MLIRDVIIYLQHVADLHADGDIGFSKEYEAIQAASAQEHHPAEHSQHPENKQKNRYLNIVACGFIQIMWDIHYY